MSIERFFNQLAEEGLLHNPEMALKRFEALKPKSSLQEQFERFKKEGENHETAP